MLVLHFILYRSWERLLGCKCSMEADKIVSIRKIHSDICFCLSPSSMSSCPERCAENTTQLLRLAMVIVPINVPVFRLSARPPAPAVCAPSVGLVTMGPHGAINSDPCAPQGPLNNNNGRDNYIGHLSMYLYVQTTTPTHSELIVRFSRHSVLL